MLARAAQRLSRRSRTKSSEPLGDTTTQSSRSATQSSSSTTHHSSSQHNTPQSASSSGAKNRRQKTGSTHSDLHSEKESSNSSKPRRTSARSSTPPRTARRSTVHSADSPGDFWDPFADPFAGGPHHDWRSSAQLQTTRRSTVQSSDADADVQFQSGSSAGTSAKGGRRSSGMKHDDHDVEKELGSSKPRRSSARSSTPPSKSVSSTTSGQQIEGWDDTIGRLKRITFNADEPLGFQLDMSTGDVSEVVEGAQAWAKGVEEGWRLKYIDGKLFDVDLLDVAIAARTPFELTFEPQNVSSAVRRASGQSFKRDPEKLKRGHARQEEKQADRDAAERLPKAWLPVDDKLLYHKENAPKEDKTRRERPEELIRIMFDPDQEAGLKVNVNTGEVFEVEAGGQAALKGIEERWCLKYVDGKDFQVKLLHAAFAKKSPYELTFDMAHQPVERPGSWISLDEGSDSNASSELPDRVQHEAIQHFSDIQAWEVNGRDAYWAREALDREERFAQDKGVKSGVRRVADRHKGKDWRHRMDSFANENRKRYQEENWSDSDEGAMSDGALDVWMKVIKGDIKDEDEAKREADFYKNRVRRDMDEATEELKDWARKIESKSSEKVKDERRRARQHKEDEAREREELLLEKKWREKRVSGARFKVDIVGAQNLRKIAKGKPPNAFCVCEVVLDKDLQGAGLPERRFVTPVVLSSGPTWNHARELFCGLGDVLRFTVYSKDAWSSESLGSVILPYEKICPGMFSGDLLLKEHGESTKASLRVRVKLLTVGVRSQEEEGDNREAEVVEEEIAKMEEALKSKRSQLQKLRDLGEISKLPMPVAPPTVKPGSAGTALPWEGPMKSTVEGAPRVDDPMPDLASIRLRRDALRVFLEGTCGSLSIAIEEVTGAPLRRSEAAFPRHQREAVKDEGVKYPRQPEFRAILEEMGLSAPPGELHWWPLLFRAVDVDEDGLVSALDLYEALVLDRPPKSAVFRSRRELLANGKSKSRSLPPPSDIEVPKLHERSSKGTAVRNESQAVARQTSENSREKHRTSDNEVVEGSNLRVEPGQHEVDAPQNDVDGISRLRVIIVSASGLRKADWRDLSDPFCTCETIVGGVRGTEPKLEFQTEVIENTLDPIWNHSHELRDANAFRSKSLIFNVWDEDTLSNDLLGTARLERDIFFPHGFEGDVVLKSASGNSARSRLKLQIEVLTAVIPVGEQIKNEVRGGSVPTGTLSRKAAETTTVSTRVKIIGAKGLRRADLMSESDPFCICDVMAPGNRKLRTYRTQVINSSRDPKWRYSFDVTVNVGDAFHFTVMDDDSGKQGDSLGFVTMQTSQFWPGGFEGDLILLEAGKNIRATLQIDIEVIPTITAFAMPKKQMVRKRKLPAKPKATAAHKHLEEKVREENFLKERQEEAKPINPYAYLEGRKTAKANMARKLAAVDAALEDEMFNQFIRWPEDRKDAKIEQRALDQLARNGIGRRPVWELGQFENNSESLRMEYLPKPKRRSGRSEAEEAAGATAAQLVEPFRPAPAIALQSVTKGLHGRRLEDIEV